MSLPILFPLCTLILAWAGLNIVRIIYNIFFHPLRAFPGPFGARATTWWKTYIEVVKQESMTDVLIRLHKKYGEIVRLGPNELHFARPAAYDEIYAPSARWDKEKTLYTSFGEDHSSFGLLTYAENKQRKDVLQPLFSRRAILNMQSLVRETMDHLVEVLTKNNEHGKSADLFLGFRCFTIDVVTNFCFAKSVHAIDEPDFSAPLVLAMDKTLPPFATFKHFPLLRKAILFLPPWLALNASPETSGLKKLQIILGKQVREVIANPEILNDTPHPTVYHRLLDPEAHKGHPIPDSIALYEEGQSLMFAGGVSTADTLMTGHFYILNSPALYQKLQAEVRTVWPDISNPPSFQAFESLPILTATIKELLRISAGAPNPLLRIVPSSGATISGKSIPGGTIVGMSNFLVHRSSDIFEDPDKFNPERWLGEGSQGLDQWLVPFSKGPRSCLGINLAWCELYIALATMLRRFEMRLDGTKLEDLKWRDCFVPYYYGRHLKAWCVPVKD